MNPWIGIAGAIIGASIATINSKMQISAQKKRDLINLRVNKRNCLGSEGVR